MATVRDIIHAALNRAHIVADGETPAAEQVAGALAVFNDMVEAWLDEGIRLGVRNLGLDDTLDADAGQRRAIKDNLAVELADNAGLPVSGLLQQRAERGRASLQARYFDSPDAKIDVGLQPSSIFSIENG